MAPVKIFVRRYDLETANALMEGIDDRYRAESEQVSGAVSDQPGTLNRLMPGTLIVTVVAIALMLAFVEVVGFAPCFLRLFCF